METKGTLTVTSVAVRDGETMPESTIYAGMGCTGDNRSPDLQWSAGPAGTKSYAITMWDPDAPTTVGFTHWVLFDIPADVTSLEDGAGRHGFFGIGGAAGTHGRNDFGDTKYDGPCPPPGHGTHHYHITVYALDVEKLGANEGASYALFRFLAREHTLATGEIVGLYSR